MDIRDKMIGHCPECGAATGCGVEQGLTHCWCFDVPRPAASASDGHNPLDPPPAELRCLCPACLQKRQKGDRRH